MPRDITKTKGYWDEVEAQDEQDERYVRAVYGPQLARCAGGRLLIPGYVCPHCNSVSPQRDCGEPMRKRIRENRAEKRNR